ncbi:MAG TPA: serine hydrolase domain-containing protein [Levilinea sp.]|nr:serine hydrolase domain-containing protein [Levilinea sp.]
MKTVLPEEVGFSSERLERITAVMQGYIERQELAGTVTAVMRRGRLAYFRCLGMANLENRLPMQPDTLFRIYSMTKPVTSAAVLMLFEEGRLRLADPVSHYLPVFNRKMKVALLPDFSPAVVDAQREITIRDLLTHTAGLSYGFDESSWLDTRYREQVWALLERNPELPLEELMTAIVQLPLAHQPGRVFRYSLATDVLGYLVSVVTGMPFGDFLQERFFDPLGMVDTFFCVPQEKRHRLAEVYNPAKNGGLEKVEPPNAAGFFNPRYFQSGGGGLVSTAADYLRFASMLLNFGELDGQRLLGRKTVELMSSNHLPAGIHPFEDHSAGFGLGVSVVLNVAASHNLGSVGRYGWSGAASTNFWIDPHEQSIGLFLTQRLESTTAADDCRNLVYQAMID